MGEPRTLLAIAESCPFDALLVMEMKSAVNSLLQLNLKRFRVPEKTITRYSALDIMKQALELLYEFSPSERNYREAMRTIQVYSEGDEEMLHILRESFSLIANAVYNAYTGQRRVESVAPDILFLQGIPIDPTELQQAFRFVGVKPPEISPPNVKKIVYLDEGFQPYKLLLEGELTTQQAQVGREDHWATVIETTLSGNQGTALIRAGSQHVDPDTAAFKRILDKIRPTASGKLPDLLGKRGILLKITDKIADINEVFGKK